MKRRWFMLKTFSKGKVKTFRDIYWEDVRTVMLLVFYLDFIFIFATDEIHILL